MNLSLKKSTSGLINIGINNVTGQDITFTVKYPTLAQVEKIERAKWQGNDFNFANMVQYARAVIKYSVKEWTGMEEPLKLVNDCIDDAQLLALTSNENNTIAIYELINAEIEFTETDKKKL